LHERPAAVVRVEPALELAGVLGNEVEDAPLVQVALGALGS